MWKLAGAVGVLAVLWGAAMAEGGGWTIEKQHEQMLYTVVRVRAGDAAGSGTVVWSGKDAAEKWHTYVVTNFHVVTGAVKVEKKWDSRLGREVKRELRSTVTVEYFAYNEWSRNVGVQGTLADIVAWDEKEDLALLETRDRENGARYVAALLPVSEAPEVKIYERLWAVGASLGHAPITTEGILNYKDDEIENLIYWMSSAQIIFGNSGGAMFRWSEPRQRFEWIGVPSRVSVTFGAVVMHMGYFIPIPRVSEFLERHVYRFIVSPSVGWEEERKAREAEEEKRRKATDLQILVGGSPE